MSNKTLLELHYFPSIQYFSKWMGAGHIFLEQHESYGKGSYRSRCHIAGANGLLRLSIPLERGKNSSCPIRDVRIASHTDWQRQHWQSIQSAYGKSPFFEFYEAEILPIFERKQDFLFDLNLQIIKTFHEIFGLPTDFSLTASFQKTAEEGVTDLRNHILPKNAPKDANFQVVEYGQVFQHKHGFLPNLSVLDLLFCKGPEAVLLLEESLLID